MLVAMLLIIRCALTLAVLGLLVLPFAFASSVSLVVDLFGIALSLVLVALAFGVSRWMLRHRFSTG